MESKNSPNAPDGDNRPPAHHGTGSGGRGRGGGGEAVKALGDEGIVVGTTGTTATMTTTRRDNSLGASRP